VELRKHGFQLISVGEPDLMQDDPYRVMFRQFQGAISQAEKANIVLKLGGARKRMRTRAGRCEGRKPYGHRPGEAEVIARMRELWASGMNFDAIAATLNSANVTTRTPGKLRRQPDFEEGDLLMIFEVYESLHLLNKSLYEATLYLETISCSGAFDTEKIDEFATSVARVRSETNVYLAGVIQQVEAPSLAGVASHVRLQ